MCGLKEERLLTAPNSEEKVSGLRSIHLPIIHMTSNHLQQGAIYAGSPRGAPGLGLLLNNVTGINPENIS